MADVVKLVNTPDCGSGISWVRAPSFAPDLEEKYSFGCTFFVIILVDKLEFIAVKNRSLKADLL